MTQRQYYTREALLLQLGPVHKAAEFVFRSDEDKLFPVKSVEERPNAKFLVVIGDKPPYDWAKHYNTLTTLELTADELIQLPTGEFEL